MGERGPGGSRPASERAAGAGSARQTGQVGVEAEGPSEGFVARKLRLREHLTYDPAAYLVLVESLYAAPVTYFLSNAVGALVPAFCAYVTGDPRFVWLSYAAFVLGIARLGIMARYRTSDRSTFPVARLVAFDWLYCVTATAFSSIIGSTTFVALVATESVPCHLLVVGSSLAFAAAYVARNAGQPVFVIIQLICFCVPAAGGLAIAQEPYYGYLAVFIASAGIANISIVFSLNRNLLQLAAANQESAQLAGSLHEQNQTLDSALNAMTHGLCMLSRDLTIKVANARFLELYGLTAADAAPGATLGSVLEILVRSQIITAATAMDLVRLCEVGARQDVPVERELVVESGQTFVVFVDRTPDGGMLLLTEDATARKAAAQQIERMARCDLLTNLPNRFSFGEVLSDRLRARSGRRAVIYVDLDDFKTVNDTLGHEAGDQLLVQVASRLQAEADGAVVARFGGDEFLVLADVERDEEARALAWRFITAIAEPLMIGGTRLSVTTSIGIAIAPDHANEASDLLRAADVALYAAKAEGRNTVVLYTPALAEVLHHRREMESDLREAVRCGRLCLHYQPIVDARTDKVRSYEALMRWQHPTKGQIPPGEFIPIAEQVGLIAQMGAWALRQACLDARQWPDHVAVAVNVSANQFKDATGFIENVKDALLISGLDPSRLELEVTESLLIVNQEATLAAIRALRRLGVRFSLDDFGNGYSSLGYIARYPFSKVKIDRSFAEHLTTDDTSRSIIEVVCQLARKLDMRVVVEGIETEAQRREIVLLGAEQAQGWLFGRPKPVAEIFPPRRRAVAG